MKIINTITLLSIYLIAISTVNAQSYLTYEELGTHKKDAVANDQYRLAKIIQDEIDKRDVAISTVDITPKKEQSDEVLVIDTKLKDAVNKEDWKLAKLIKQEKNTALGLAVVPPKPKLTYWKDGIYPNHYIFRDNGDGSISYRVDKTDIWNHFKKTGENSYVCDKSSGKFANNNIGTTLIKTDESHMEMLYKGDGKTYRLTSIGSVANLGTSDLNTNLAASNKTIIFPQNLREKEFVAIKKNNSLFAEAPKLTPPPKPAGEDSKITSDVSKLKNAEGNQNKEDLKYRRSSLYTLMINDESRLHASVIKDAFGNSTLPQKFNNHNIGPYVIDAKAAQDDQSSVITNYLNTSDVAKSIVAKWFNRNAEGKFNMNLIADRGMYDASAMDKVVANSTERGNSMLADAGEELIGNTFVIINDFKYISKEEAVKKGKGWSSLAKSVTAYVPGGSAIKTGITAAETAATIAGKGYWVRTTSYLYRLVWNEETASVFYNNYWTDQDNFDPTKVTAFDNATDFQLKLIGSQTASADIQSSIFTDKSEQDLIRMATVKATDRAIAKLERKYEEFRTKTPLYSADPITAKIGLKEGLEGGDKFEVLEQRIDPETGKTTYKRVGVVKVDSKNIWDNSLTPEEIDQLKKEGKLPKQQYTIFKGSGKYYPGQLIKQIK